LSPQQYKSIVVLTGAGISAESGISTFRALDGLWENYRVEEVASPQGFAATPSLVHRFYNGRRQQLISGTVQPNRAHLALAELEARSRGKFLLVTQNIDDLHERAGAKNVIHMHGELLKQRCAYCGDIGIASQALKITDICARCHRTGGIRPHVVWFGEMPLRMEEIYAALKDCDLFVAIGTSGHVYPAAGFVDAAAAVGAHTVELNLEPSAMESAFADKKYGPAGTVVPEFISTLEV
jgi:NAD-dependent deacetylase